jgi:hypothetical protein
MWVYHDACPDICEIGVAITGRIPANGDHDPVENYGQVLANDNHERNLRKSAGPPTAPRQARGPQSQPCPFACQHINGPLLHGRKIADSSVCNR